MVVATHTSGLVDFNSASSQPGSTVGHRVALTFCFKKPFYAACAHSLMGSTRQSGIIVRPWRVMIIHLLIITSITMCSPSWCKWLCIMMRHKSVRANLNKPDTDRGQGHSMDWMGDVGLMCYYSWQMCDHYLHKQWSPRQS